MNNIFVMHVGNPLENLESEVFESISLNYANFTERVGSSSRISRVAFVSWKEALMISV